MDAPDAAVCKPAFRAGVRSVDGKPPHVARTWGLGIWGLRQATETMPGSFLCFLGGADKGRSICCCCCCCGSSHSGFNLATPSGSNISQYRAQWMNGPPRSWHLPPSPAQAEGAPSPSPGGCSPHGVIGRPPSRVSVGICCFGQGGAEAGKPYQVELR